MSCQNPPKSLPPSAKLPREKSTSQLALGEVDLVERTVVVRDQDAQVGPTKEAVDGLHFGPHPPRVAVVVVVDGHLAAALFEYDLIAGFLVAKVINAKPVFLDKLSERGTSRDHRAATISLVRDVADDLADEAEGFELVKRHWQQRVDRVRAVTILALKEVLPPRHEEAAFIALGVRHDKFSDDRCCGDFELALRLLLSPPRLSGSSGIGPLPRPFCCFRQSDLREYICHDRGDGHQIVRWEALEHPRLGGDHLRVVHARDPELQGLPDAIWG